MRITSGKYRGRIIKMPRGIRPTQEKVRKAIFDILGDIEGLTFLELFSGSGAVGFEAVSRGVAELTMVECDRESWLAIKKNIESLKLKACDLYPAQVDAAIIRFHKENRLFDIIFLDPPYFKGRVPRLRPSTSLGTTLSERSESKGRSGLTAASFNESLAKKTLQILGAYDILAPNGLVVVQHFKKDTLLDKAGNLTQFKEATYADTVLSFYRKDHRT